jgi:hypothetical protein
MFGIYNLNNISMHVFSLTFLPSGMKTENATLMFKRNSEKSDFRKLAWFKRTNAYLCVLIKLSRVPRNMFPSIYCISPPAIKSTSKKNQEGDKTLLHNIYQIGNRGQRSRVEKTCKQCKHACGTFSDCSGTL